MDSWKWLHLWPFPREIPKLKVLGGSQLVTILPLFLWVSSHAEWICDSLNKHSGEWFLAFPSHVFKSGLHHPSNYEKRRRKSLRKPNDCLFSTWVKYVFILFVYYGKSGTGTNLGVSPTCQWANWENYYISSGLKSVTKFRNVKSYYSFLFGELISLDNTTWLVSSEFYCTAKKINYPYTLNNAS